MSDQIQKSLEEKLEKSIESLKSELNAVRAGRANPLTQIGRASCRERV